jgi:hypothetical protein
LPQTEHGFETAGASVIFSVTNHLIRYKEQLSVTSPIGRIIRYAVCYLLRSLIRYALAVTSLSFLSLPPETSHLHYDINRQGLAVD